MKNIRNVFIILAILLSNIMSAVVAYNFCDMQWGIEYAGYSAPASVALWYSVPFLIGIGICILLIIRFNKKTK